MSAYPDLLEAVIAELKKRKGDLPAVAEISGVSYDTVHRIKGREGGVRYASLRALADAMGLKIRVTAK